MDECEPHVLDDRNSIHQDPLFGLEVNEHIGLLLSYFIRNIHCSQWLGLILTFLVKFK